MVTLIVQLFSSKTKAGPILSDKKSNEEMLGEVLREIGVLIVVFFPFDEWITFHELTWKFALGSVLMSAAFVAAGMWLENMRQR
jgi:hypothetical protein